MSQFFGLVYNENMQVVLERLRKDYPELRFRSGKRFSFRPVRTIIFEAVGLDEFAVRSVAEQNYWYLQLLHEVGHAVLEHKNFTTDPERLQMERAAWEQARVLCKQYGVKYDEDFVETELDTYRNWLHRKSCCSKCGLTRCQLRNGKYYCPNCDML